VIKLPRKTRGRAALRRLGFAWDTLADVHWLSSAKDAVAALIKRLAHRNANVQLYTLEVCAGSDRATAMDFVDC
jgi:hypothetical protein